MPADEYERLWYKIVELQKNCQYGLKSKA